MKNLVKKLFSCKLANLLFVYSAITMVIFVIVLVVEY